PVCPSLEAARAAARAPAAQGPVRVAVVGCGYWGPNLIRNFTTCPASTVVALCDQNAQTLAKAGALCPAARHTQEVAALLDDPEVEAVAIATPVGTHAPLATQALQAGKHVLVEKPLATSAREAEALVRLAERQGLTLMVDHTFIYSEPVRKIKQLIDDGELG